MQKMTVTTTAVATAKFKFGICDCRVDNDVDTSDFARAVDFTRVWTRARVSGHGLRQREP